MWLENARYRPAGPGQAPWRLFGLAVAAACLAAGAGPLDAVAEHAGAPRLRVGAVPDDLKAKLLTLPVVAAKPDDLRPDFYGPRGQRGHEAIDIVAPWGEAVVAVEDGTIARLFASERGGLTVYQYDPGRKYVYYYAHLAHYADNLAAGDAVKRGQLIGYVGTTGNARQPHLHFAIFLLGPRKSWWNGEPLDPYPVLVQP